MTRRFRDKIGRGIRPTTGTPTQLARQANLLSGAQTGTDGVPEWQRVIFCLFCINFYQFSG